MLKIRMLNYISTAILIILCLGTIFSVSDNYLNLAIVSLIYSFLTASFFLVHKYSVTMPVLIIRCTGLIRYIVLPLNIIYNHEQSFCGDNFTAVIMILEAIIVHIVLVAYYHRLKKKGNSSRKTNENLNRTIIRDNYIDSFKLGTTTTIILVAGIVIALINPATIKNYFSFNLAGKASIDLFGMYGIILKIMFFLLFIYFLGVIRKVRFLSVTMKLLLSILLAVIYTNGQGVTAYGVSRWTLLMCIIASLVFILSLYPKYKKQIIFGAVVLVPAIIFAGTVAKLAMWGTTYTGISDVFKRSFGSATLNSYFSGPLNLEKGLEMLGYGNYSKVQIFITDLFANCPLINHYTNTATAFSTTTLFNYAFYGNSISKDQICPMIIQLYQYFSFFGIVVYGLIVFIALKLNTKTGECNTLLLKNVYIIIVFYFSLVFCINWSILLEILWQQALPLLLIDKFNYHLSVRK